MLPRLLLISPVYNEGAHIEAVVRSVAEQERPPARWIVVDDGSTDGTLETLRTLAGDVPFMEVLQAPAKGPMADRLAVALEARAFNLGLRHAGDLDGYDYIGKLDGDIRLPPTWFATLLGRMDADATLGIAGASLIEPLGDGWRPLIAPAYHVHGATKIYRRDCFDRIGGVQERLGWDTIDETYARMYGFRTERFADVVAEHLRPAASADGQLRGRARHGECAWILHYPPLWVVLRSFKVALDPPRVMSGAWFLWGYIRSALRRTDRVDDAAFRRFVRKELRARLVRGRAAA